DPRRSASGFGERIISARPDETLALQALQGLRECDSAVRRLPSLMNPGILSAALAYVCWGLFPLYFKQLASVSPSDVLAHRIVWSLLFVMLILVVKRHWAWLRPAIRQPKLLAAFTASALLLSANWL